MSKIKNNKILLCGLLCALLGLLTFGYYIWIGDGFFIVREDFNEQQIPFTVGLHQALLDGGLGGWNWSQGLGNSTLQGYSFYELGSPFFWITMLFPAKAFPYICGWIFILKYVVAGVLAFIWLRRFVKNEDWAIVAAVIYAFSGYSTLNLMYYHFHDVVALFPLLLIGLEIMLEKGDFRLFTFAVALNCFLNYFFFIGEVVFLVIYFLFRYFSQDSYDLGRPSVKETGGPFVKLVAKCMGCGVLGVAMAAVLFVPSVMYISNSPRVSNASSQFEHFWTWKQVLYVLKAYILPAEAMTDLSCLYPSRFHSGAVYLPFLGIVFVIAYIIKKRDWLSRITLLMVLGSFVPLIGSVFYLYKDNQMRWLYMLVLMMSLASVRVLENIDEIGTWPIRIGAGINAVLLIAFFILIEYVCTDDEGASLLYSQKRFIIYMIAATISLVAAYILVRFRKAIFRGKRYYKIMLVMTCLCAVMTSWMTLHVYRNQGKSVEEYKSQYDMACQVELTDSQYRFNTASNVDTMVSYSSGFSLFTSTDITSSKAFDDLFDYYVPTYGINKNTYPGLAELLGGKWFLSLEPYGNIVSTIETSQKTYYLIEEAACPIGFGVTSYIRESELRSLPVESRAVALLQAVCVADDLDASMLTGLTEMKASDIITADENGNVDNVVYYRIAVNNEAKVNDFAKDGHGMTFTTGYENDTWVYLSVPYDMGWSATIDGEEAEIVYTGGMMMINVPAGEHSVEFSYVTPFYQLGLTISLIGIVVFVVVCIWYGRRKNK